MSQLDDVGEILLTRGQNPVARVAAIPAATTPQKRVLGLHEGQGWISDDFTDDLPLSFWLGDDS